MSRSPASVQVFDPPMCCASGVCGPGVDPELARFSADLDWLRTQGVNVARFNLSQQPGAFVEHEPVKAALHARGNAVLPLVLVDGRVAMEGAYPSRETLAALAGIVVRKLQASSETASCCGPGAPGSGPSKKTSCC
jgi:hypothetical protein